MNLELAKKLIDISIEAGVKVFRLIGGEPTIHSQFLDIVKYLISYNVKIVVVTNGIKLQSDNFCRMIQKLNYNNIHFGISLKGASDEEYLNDCGLKAFNLVVQGMLNCEKYGFDYYLSYVLSLDNLQNIELFAKRIKPYVKKPIFFSFCNDIIPLDGNVEKTKTDILLKMDSLFAEKYEEICKILDNKFSLHQTFPLCLCSKDVFEKLYKANRVATSCHVHKRNGIIFDVDGSLLFCNPLAGFSFGKFGSDYNDLNSLQQFWDSEYVNNMYKKFTSMPAYECEKCKISAKCGGGCCIQWFSQNFQSYKQYAHDLQYKTITEEVFL